jgi:hypothetical protein
MASPAGGATNGPVGGPAVATLPAAPGDTGCKGLHHLRGRSAWPDTRLVAVAPQAERPGDGVRRPHADGRQRGAQVARATMSRASRSTRRGHGTGPGADPADALALVVVQAGRPSRCRS